MDYLEYWRLQEKPFEERCATRFFFESEDHREALDRLMYVVKDRNMSVGLLTGEIGSGKTITKDVFCGSLSPHHFEVIDFATSDFPFVDILFDIVKRVSQPRTGAGGGADLPARGDKYHLMSEFKRLLDLLTYQQKRHLVLVFDEAQQMDEAVLDDIRSLTNISPGSESYLTVFLVGQPELRLKVRKLRQLDQRIFLRFHLNNLDFGSTVKYIHHRLRIAGIERDSIFSDAAYELIFRSTGGVPREVNRLCKLALTFGFANTASEISPEDVQAVLDDLGEHG